MSIVRTNQRADFASSKIKCPINNDNTVRNMSVTGSSLCSMPSIGSVHQPVQPVNMMSINVNGLKGKLKSPDFERYILHFEFIFLSETKLNNIEILHIDGFSLFSKNRQKCKHTSGGVALLVKTEMKNSVTLLDTVCENVVLCRIDASILGKPVILGSVYIPPKNSRYSKIDIFDDIEQEITEGNRASHDIVLAGDFNARTGMIKENLHDSLDIFNENQKDICDRKSEDCVINNYGHRLVELCSNLNIIIINGRAGTDSGKVICKNASLVDYFICSPSLLNQVVSFKVYTFDLMFSYVQCMFF